MISGLLLALLGLGVLLMAMVVAVLVGRPRMGGRRNDPCGGDGGWHSASAHDGGGSGEASGNDSGDGGGGLGDGGGGDGGGGGGD